MVALSTSHKHVSRIALVAATALIASLAVSGCAQLDPDYQDRQACEKISEILQSAGETGFGTSSADAGKTSASADSVSFDEMANQLENDAIPLASMKFGETLTRWVHGLRKIHSGSMFVAVSGWISGTSRFVQVSTHCISVEMKDS